jgi:hypothetical protein
VARLTRLLGTTRKRRLGVLDGRFRIPDDLNRPLPDIMLVAQRVSDSLVLLTNDAVLASHGEVVWVV